MKSKLNNELIKKWVRCYVCTHLTNIVRVIKSRRLIWAGHVARMEEVRSAFKILKGKPTIKRPLGRSGIDGRTILEWTLKR